MPWIVDPPDPSYPWGYATKERYTRRYLDRYPSGYEAWKTETYARPRLPPWYFDKGYAFYKERMDSWMRQLERENKEYWERQSKFNGRKLYKSLQQTLGTMLPVYYTYPEFLAKAKKYTLRKRRQLLLKRKIEANRQQAQLKRKLFLRRDNN